MHLSQPLTAVVVGLSVVAAVGSLAVLVLSEPGATVIAVVALVVLALVAATVLGARSRRWLTNPYW